MICMKTGYKGCKKQKKEVREWNINFGDGSRQEYLR